MEEIAAYEHEMADYMYRRLSSVPGVSILGPSANRTAICAFSHETVHPSDLSTFMDMEGVAIRAGHHCCQPLHTELGYSHSARASLYFYNTKECVGHFLFCVNQLLFMFMFYEYPHLLVLLSLFLSYDRAETLTILLNTWKARCNSLQAWKVVPKTAAASCRLCRNRDVYIKVRLRTASSRNFLFA